MYPWKGVDALLRAFARVKAAGARLVVIGGVPGEGDFERVKALAASLGLDAGRVEFRGPVGQPEATAALATANVVVAPFLESAMTSEHTSPIKAFEAMAAGRALVISDTKASREIVEDGVTALFAKPGDEASWAEALDRALSDRALQTRLARAAFETAPRYAWRRRGERLRDLFAEIP
jgi:glycosyltransferase involved in cell wall biosynthesis